MKQFFSLLEGLAWVAVIAGLVLALGGCATTADAPQLLSQLSQPVDSAVARRAAAVQRQLVSTGRVKFKGPVTIQLGDHNTGSATDAHKAHAPVAASPGAVATEAKTGGTPWYVYAGLVLVGFTGGLLLRGKWKLPFPL